MNRQDTPPPFPFDLDDSAAYERWCEWKLTDYPTDLGDLVVEIRDPAALTPAEHDALLQRVRKTNMALYASARGDDPDKELIRALGRQFGLEQLDHNMCADDDAITSLRVQPDALHQGYIPYSDRPIAWHTDGYYNDLDHQILGLLLHCVQPAAKGGANELLDHEILYMQLRDLDPEYVRVLMHPEAMTIPENREPDGSLRPASVGPVFYPDPETGALQMRYTARTRSIEWRNDALTREAVAFLQHTLEAPDPLTISIRFKAGQGVLCNNVLHDRTGFDAGKVERSRRVMYRVRFTNRVKGT